MTSPKNRRAVFLDEMGVGPLWERRSGTQAAAEPITRNEMSQARAKDVAPAPTPAVKSIDPKMNPSATAPSAAEIAGMDWAELKASVAACVKCGLCASRTKTVFGAGDEKAKWLFIGEGPGRNEDLQGEPFVGPAGKLLDNMLLAMGLKRGENAYIANIVKCRPVGADGRDRPPTQEEAAACRPYLDRQIELIKPAIIVALGKTAAISLLGLDQNTAVASMRGKIQRYGGLPLVVTYHPAYLLRKLTDKDKAWRDLCLAMNFYATAQQ